MSGIVLLFSALLFAGAFLLLMNEIVQQQRAARDAEAAYAALEAKAKKKEEQVAYEPANSVLAGMQDNVQTG